MHFNSRVYLNVWTFTCWKFIYIEIKCFFSVFIVFKKFISNLRLQSGSKPDGSLLQFLSFSFLSDAARRHETAPNPHLLSCAFGQSTSTFFLLLPLSVLPQKGHFVSNDHPAHVSICPIFHPTPPLAPSLCCPSLLLSAIHGLITLLSLHSDLSIHPPPPLLSSYFVWQSAVPPHTPTDSWLRLGE